MEKVKKRYIGRIVISAILILAVFILMIAFLTEREWFSQMGYVAVFYTNLTVKLVLGGGIAILSLFLTLRYLHCLQNNYFERIASSDAPKMKKLHILTWVSTLVTVAIIVAVSVTRLWYGLLLFLNATDFGKPDPIFHLDISFYVFRLDFLTDIVELVVLFAGLFVFLTLGYYLVLLSVRTPDIYKVTAPAKVENDEKEMPEPPAGLIANIRNFIDGLTITQGYRGGIRIKKANDTSRRLDKSDIKQLLCIADKELGILGCIFFAAVAVSLLLKPYELLYTHNGAVYGAGFTDVHITVWRYRVLALLSAVFAVLILRFMKQKEFFKGTALFAILAISCVLSGGIGTAIQNQSVAPNELTKERPYLTYNMEYTRNAYGLDHISVQPLSENDTLPESQTVAASADHTALHFGEFEKHYTVIQGNDYTAYEQNGGIRMTGWNRALFALREQSFEIWSADRDDPEAQLILFPNVMERVKRIMPQLTYIGEPYLVEADGRPCWITDGVTGSAYFPYSEPYNTKRGTYNYMRNTVKVVVDATTGETTFYLMDADEPIAAAVKKIYPSLFTDFSTMPAALRENLRYPAQLLAIQGKMLATYHYADVETFYAKADQWMVDETQSDNNAVLFRKEGAGAACAVLNAAYSQWPYGQLSLYCEEPDKLTQKTTAAQLLPNQ